MSVMSNYPPIKVSVSESKLKKFCITQTIQCVEGVNNNIRVLFAGYDKVLPMIHNSNNFHFFRKAMTSPKLFQTVNYNFLFRHMIEEIFLQMTRYTLIRRLCKF